MWYGEDPSEEVEDSSNARTVAKILVNGLPNLTRLRLTFDWHTHQMSIVIGNQAGKKADAGPCDRGRVGG